MAFNQNGSETKVDIFAKTLLDEFYPKIVHVKLSIYRFSANIYIDLMAIDNFQQNGVITTDFYLNNELIYEDLKTVMEY